MSFFSSASFAAAMKRRQPTGSVAMGFSVKTCLPALIGGLEVHGAVAGRRAQHDDVDVGVDELLVGVEADEVVVGRHLDARRDGVLTRSSAVISFGLPSRGTVMSA